MRILDVLLGRTRPVPPDLDRLFTLPAAAVILQAASSWRPTGVGAVCVKPASGGAFTGVAQEIDRLLSMDGGRYERRTDSFGYSWLLRRTGEQDLAGLVTDLHAANATVRDAGFGPALLCTVVGFTDGSRPMGLIYLYKRGTWYPFVPAGDQRRDNPAELEVREMLAGELPIEPDLSRWFPLWGAPGIDAPGRDPDTHG
ncbi:hypothetical protein ThrDRAFT_04072 [Frankia casuarinae]|jgi:hypothetical protein|uniref:Uncharacterized protein n=1 Tax=Frankia casuarinae (strain DSM 45818 / CECT 9043 / HFP020203 / CcI3) TaxID=106370 RepID=Q2JAU3_FRACC|nr:MULTISPECIES: hypothetical protein [Frankia]ABD11599.1 conserved hypothetical protein [Frankia casuarinae]ETA00102.1 hypothetical protein CcI6DRAFT_04478 [Frankia sp. CcI6]EYT90305.1 hypothetical protein ThrDRAFT_04072 [Frankia casuarinae]KDA41131.1 hypothetical protein BMG523Draft_04054 [Frankia sp. BMG5.23]KEZ34648.1 hypothetical protein CEDDRAFT_03991 [Frankia sp. CeD]